MCRACTAPVWKCSNSVMPPGKGLMSLQQEAVQPTGFSLLSNLLVLPLVHIGSGVEGVEEAVVFESSACRTGCGRSAVTALAEQTWRRGPSILGRALRR
uniref:Uncharacterized protein n=1 Tax=Anguilla anguilla TaxID=7936 RepID=A0A0E9TK45_ANGAN